jgi:uncharacterized protein (DUF983 family)
VRKLLNLVVGRIKAALRSDPEPDDPPRYGSSVSYAACPACGEGSLTYDETAGTSVCNACGARADE